MNKSQKAEWLERLSEWTDVLVFQGLVSECKKDLGRYGAMINHGTGFWRDAWIAGKFAELLAVDSVRLLYPETSPDFAVMIAGTERRFEATEAMAQGRRRGDEFREDLAKADRGESTARNHPVEDWLTGDRAAELLKAAADRKAGKSYARGSSLVIYLNDSDYGADEANIVRSFQPATETAGSVFQAVHVLWGSRCFHVWERGIPI